jgi:hypothetical protein
LALILPADAAVDQDDLRTGAHQQWARRQRNPIACVRRRPLLPHRLWDRAEHGAAVETKEPIDERRDVELAERHE